MLADEFDAFLWDRGEDPDAEFLLGDAVAALGAHGGSRVKVVPTTERFLGITYAEDVAGVTADIAGLIDNGRYPARLWP